MTSSGFWFSTWARGETKCAYSSRAAGSNSAIRWQFWNATRTPKCRSTAARMASLATSRSPYQHSGCLTKGDAESG